MNKVLRSFIHSFIHSVIHSFVYVEDFTTSQLRAQLALDKISKTLKLKDNYWFVTNCSLLLLLLLERFSNDCRKTKTKVITPTNHDRGKQRDEPITPPSNYLKLAQSAGKITRTRRDWFWFCFSLAEKLARVF